METIDFRPELAGAFKALNAAWISRFFALEAKDLAVLDDPVGKALGAPRLYIETNSALGPALGLYRSFGFVELTGKTRGPGDYARVDVWMELRL